MSSVQGTFRQVIAASIHFLLVMAFPSHSRARSLTSRSSVKVLKAMSVYTRSDKKSETNPISREPRVEGERQTDGYRTCSDLSQCYKAQLDRFTQYK